MSNVYNITFFKPALTADEMYKDMEQLAQELVETGRLRIDADEKINFVRHVRDDTSLFFSHRELYDKAIVPYVERQIGKKNLEHLRTEMSTNQPVSVELEEKIARLLVQSAHPAVIRLAIYEGIEIFVSFSHNIADLLDLQTFQKHGGNSGMQSLGFMESRVFVSTDGNPFSNIKEEKEHAKYSMSRFMVIAAQELGHYADVMRDHKGNVYSRHSAELVGFRAKPRIKKARIKDLQWSKKTCDDLEELGLSKVAKLEKSITFFHKHRRNSYRHRWIQLKSYFATSKFQKKAMAKKITFAKIHPARFLKILLSDMKFNLHPIAPVYQDKNPVVEEAIICVEALARVPQQVVKWGHRTTKYLYPNLYKIYYEEVIPAVIKNYEQRSGVEFYMEYHKPKRSLARKLVGTD